MAYAIMCRSTYLLSSSSSPLTCVCVYSIHGFYISDRTMSKLIFMPLSYHSPFPVLVFVLVDVFCIRLPACDMQCNQILLLAHNGNNQPPSMHFMFWFMQFPLFFLLFLLVSSLREEKPSTRWDTKSTILKWKKGKS